tara:strand:+ start:1287 stop:1580 length:294 start_codon:yes stop_codon:yes gene_type:complete
MQKKTSNVREIEVGDLVYHILYGHEWVGILLDIMDVYDYNDHRSSTHREMGLVQMQPGTEYELFFKTMVSNSNKVSDSMGLVSTNWLFRLEKRKRRK